MNEEIATKIKDYLLSRNDPSEHIKETQLDLLYRSKLKPGANPEKYEQKFLDIPTYLDAAKKLLISVPVEAIRNELTHAIESFHFPYENQEMNIGQRVSYDDFSSLKFEQWANVVDYTDNSKITMSLHTTFSQRKFEIHLITDFFSYQFEFSLDGQEDEKTIAINSQVADDNESVLSCDTAEESVLNQPIENSENSHNINNNEDEEIDTSIPQSQSQPESQIVEASPPSNTLSSRMSFIRYANGAKHSYTVVRSANNREVSTEVQYQNDGEQQYEIFKEIMHYTNDKNNKTIPKKVIRETTKSNLRTKYLETNYESYNVDPVKKCSFGKKRYKNSNGRVYKEDWHRIELDRGGYENRLHSFLDTGLGEQTTIDSGTRIEGDTLIFEYEDKYENNIGTGDELTTKKGRDKINQWSSTNRRNRVQGFSHVENHAQNFAENLEWMEKWDEDDKGKYCKKWGKNENEEWEEEWKETEENGDKIKVCSKKCKQLKEDKEWFETWTEKNNDKPNCEKTCYKMNRTGNNKFENYWGNIIVNYLDNKRMNYVGFITNNDKKEFVNYTYENTNN